MIGRRRLVGKADTARPRQQHIKHPFLGRVLGARAELLGFLFAHHLHRTIHQIADDRLDIAPDIADFGELGGFHLQKGRIGQLGQSPGDLGLADTGRPDHQNVLGGDFVAQLRRYPHPPPAVAQGNGHGALGSILTNDVLVQFLDDFSGGHLRHDEATIHG